MILKIFLTICLPFIIIYTFITNFYEELKNAFWYAISHCKSDISTYIRTMKEEK